MARLAKIWVSGLVQGVGFRYYVHKTAGDYGITGWVRNLADGRVYIEAQGSESALRGFLADVRTGSRSSHVTDVALVWDDSATTFTGFEIRF